MNELFDHQKKGVEFIISKGVCGALFWEMGLGKTRGALEMFRRIRQKESGLKMFVICPLSLLEAAWREDMKRFMPEFSFQNLHDEPSISERPDIYAINFEALIHAKRAETIKAYFKTHPALCVIDESSRMKNHSAKTTKMILKMRDLFKYRLVMSGTPAPNSETEYWAQMEFVRQGLLHPSFFAFRNTYFHLERNGQIMQSQGMAMTRMAMREIFSKGWKYSITAMNRKKLMARIDPWCHRARKADCLDLPEQIDEIRLVEMAPAQRRAYDELKRHLITEIQGQNITAQTALTKLQKLRQCSSGFFYNENGEALEVLGKVTYGSAALMQDFTAKEFENPKLNELFDIIEEAGDQPIIIWINFHWEQIKICHELHRKFGENQVVTLSALTKDKDESIAAFRDGRARFMVAHPRSAAHGLTFVNCSLQVFFSLDWSWEAYKQARARTHRAGQVNRCTYVHIIAKDSIDEDILRVLKKKGDAQEMIYEIMKK